MVLAVLDEFLQNSQDHIDFILNTLPLLKDNIDYLNFHSYADFHHIDTVIVWIREKMNEANYQAPLFCNEHGIKINPDSSYDKQGLDQARDLFKQVIIDIPQGCTRINLIDAVGNVTEMEALDGSLTIELNATPIMIEFIDSETRVHTSRGKTQPSPSVLYPPFPNPFNCGVTIQFLLPCHQHVRLDIFNILGQHIDTIIDHPMTAGRHNFLWNARGMSSGSYLVQLRTSSFIQHQKIKFLK